MVSSANVLGFRQHFKRMDFFNFIRKYNPDIICQQETHLIKKKITMPSWKSGIYDI